MVASIGKIASPAQGVGYFERDGYYTKDDGAHREASAWAGRGAEALGLEGPVDPEAFRRVLEGEVPGGRRLGRKEPDGSIRHRRQRGQLLDQGVAPVLGLLADYRVAVGIPRWPAEEIAAVVGEWLLQLHREGVHQVFPAVEGSS